MTVFVIVLWPLHINNEVEFELFQPLVVFLFLTKAKTLHEQLGLRRITCVSFKSAQNGSGNVLTLVVVYLNQMMIDFPYSLKHTFIIN